MNKNPDDKEEKTDVSQSSKRKSEDEEVKDNKAPKTSKAEKDSTEEETHVPKRELEKEDANDSSDKRPRVQNDATIRENITLDTIQRDFNISLLQKKKYKSLRNREYDVKAVAKGQTSRLLKLTARLPDVDKFHDNEKFEDVSSHIAWDDLTGMKLEAAKVIEARKKEMGYIKEKGVWTKIPRAVALAVG